MAEYYSSLTADLVDQFRDKQFTAALVSTIATQLDEVAAFLSELMVRRDVYTAEGEQLDGIGDIVALNRTEAGLMTGNPIPIDVLDDENYRKYLIFKIMKNTSDGTYPDIVKAIRMLYGGKFQFHEYPDVPATIFLDVERFEFNDIATLLSIPIIKAGGVQIRFRATATIENRIYTGALISQYRNETLQQRPYEIVDYLTDEDGNILSDEAGDIIYEGSR